MGEWLRGPLKEWGEGLLSEANIEKSGVFSPTYIRSLWIEHQSGKRDHRKKLWNILVFLEWRKRFF
jgi:asparagine synthase (glutamine-hydrolysing)